MKPGRKPAIRPDYEPEAVDGPGVLPVGPPAQIIDNDTEAMKARIAELEAKIGQQILGLLCMVAHPFAPRVRDNPQDTAAADGRAEVVALLIEIGARGAIAVPVLTQTTQCQDTQ